MYTPQVFPNPLRAAVDGVYPPPSSSGVMQAVETTPGSGDLLTGEIQCPRVPPHRYLRPTKSCLKRSSDQTMYRRVSFAYPRCIITGVPLPLENRVRRQQVVLAVPRQKGKRQSSAAKRAAFLKAAPDWTSACDEPMTGMSDEEDAIAFRYREEEAELDRRHEIAARFTQFNKADSPITHKRYRSHHPAVIKSRARSSRPKPGPRSVPPPSR